MWRKAGGREEIAKFAAGLALGIPTGPQFQFRNDGLDIPTVPGSPRWRLACFKPRY
jgi:hypothetical protein